MNPTYPADVEARIARVVSAARLPDRMRDLRVPGVSVAVVNGGALAWARGFGQGVDAGTLFQAASTSKPVAAVGALRLAQDGRVDLDADVNGYLRSWKVPASPAAQGRPVTLRELLSHTAGTTVHGFAGYPRGGPVPTLLQVLDGRPPARSSPVRVATAPGTAFAYSGGGFLVVQQLVVDVSGLPFADYMARAVLGPAGMAASTFEQPLPRDRQGNVAPGHRLDGSEVPGGWNVYPELAAAGLWTTAADMARFVVEVVAAANGGGRALSQATAAAMLTPQRPGGYGLGVVLNGRGAALRFNHGGVNSGYRTHFAGLPATGQGIVVLTNGDRGRPIYGDVLRAVEAEYGWPPVDGGEDAAAEPSPLGDAEETPNGGPEARPTGGRKWLWWGGAAALALGGAAAIWGRKRRR